MTIVVDASVALNWTIETPQSDKARQLLRSREALISPDLIIVEMANALYYSVRERTDRVQRALDGLEFLPRWFSELVPASPLRHGAMACAMRLEHPLYDCFYLALALERRVPFVTADERFVRKAAASEYGRHVVSLTSWKPQ